jgi:hypothetical protein
MNGATVAERYEKLAECAEAVDGIRGRKVVEL